MSNIVIGLLIGLLAGWLSGLVGIGGGIMIVPALMFMAGYAVKDAQGTSIAALIPPIGLMAAYVFYKQGHVNIRMALLIAVGFLGGAYLGAMTNATLSSRAVEKIFAFALILIAVKMLWPR